MKRKNMTPLHARKSIGRLPWALALCLTLAMQGLGLSANAQERNTTITTFDAPGAGTGPFQGTAGYAINSAGEIAGQYIDPSDVYHGCACSQRCHHGVDAPGAGSGPGQGTARPQHQPGGGSRGFLP